MNVASVRMAIWVFLPKVSIAIGVNIGPPRVNSYQVSRAYHENNCAVEPRSAVISTKIRGTFFQTTFQLYCNDLTGGDVGLKADKTGT